MSLTSLVRRSVAVTTATALLTGGLAALAAPVLAAPVVASVSPASWDNRSDVTLTITGSGFSPKGELCLDEALPTCDYNTVVFKPVLPDPSHEVNAFEFQANLTESTTSLTVRASLAMAPTGQYKVVVKDANGVEASPSSPNFSIYGFGAASATKVAAGTSGTRPGAPLDVTGVNFAIGAKVQFLKAGVVDPGITFAPGSTGTGGNGANRLGTVATGTGYPSSTLIQGGYTLATDANATTPGFLPGRHALQVVNKDGVTTGQTVDFVQPWFTAANVTVGGVSPARIGQGSTATPLTITGQGFTSTSKIVVESLATTGCTDVSVGASTVSEPGTDSTFTKITAPVSFAGCSPAGLRDVSVIGTDGAVFTRTDALSVSSPPTFTSIEAGFDVLGQGARIGYPTTSPCETQTCREPFAKDIKGTGFVGDAETDPAKMTSFSFGPGVTVTTVDILNPTTARVTVDVAPDAATGARSATATNPDGGSSTVAPDAGLPIPGDETAPFTVTAGPKVTSLSPSALQPTNSVTVIATGVFNPDHTYTVAESPDDEGITIGTPTVVDATHLSFPVSTTTPAAGVHTLVVTSSVDYGRAVCECLAVDSLTVTSVTPGSMTSNVGQVSNSGPVTVAVTATGVGAVNGASTATLTRQTAAAGQGSIVDIGLTSTGANSATTTLDVTHAAPGLYNLTVVLDPASPSSGTWVCTACINITGQTVVVQTIVPNTGARGATDRALTINGSGFSQGMQIVVEGLTVHDPHFDSATKLTALLDIPADAALGGHDVSVTPANGQGGVTVVDGYTVSAAPTTQGVQSGTPAAYGQGAGTVGTKPQLKVQGLGFQQGATLSLGEGITATTVSVVDGGETCPILPIDPCTENADTLTADLVIAQTAVVGKRAATVTNPDGGTSTKADAFTVNAGPKVLSVAGDGGYAAIAPSSAERTVTLTINGTGFVADPKSVVTLSPGTGLTVGTVTVVSSSKITVPVTIAANAPKGVQSVAVKNPGDQGYGSCATCLYVASKASAPQNLVLAPVMESSQLGIKATWAAPTSNGGAPITSYLVTATRSGTTAPAVTREVSSATLTATLRPVVSNATYVVAVRAVTAAGPGSTAAKSTVAGLLATLVAKQSVKTVTYGSRVVYTGRLTRTGTTVGIAQRAIRLTFVPAFGKAFSQTVSTTSTGTWAFAYTPKVPTASLTRTSQYTVKVYPVFLGDYAYRRAYASTLVTSVAPRVVISSPVSGSRTSASTTIKVTGSILPSKAGRTVYLYRFTSSGRTLLAKTTVSSSSTYAFSIRPGRGTYTLRVYIPATPGNVAAYSSSIVISRV